MKVIAIRGIIEELIALISFLTTVLKFSGDDEVKIAAWVFFGLDGFFLLSYIIHWGYQIAEYGWEYDAAADDGERGNFGIIIEVLDDILADAGTAVMAAVMVINQAKRDHSFTFKVAATALIVLIKNVVKIAKHVVQLLKQRQGTRRAAAWILREPRQGLPVARAPRRDTLLRP